MKILNTILVLTMISAGAFAATLGSSVSVADAGPVRGAATALREAADVAATWGTIQQKWHSIYISLESLADVRGVPTADRVAQDLTWLLERRVEPYIFVHIAHLRDSHEWLRGTVFKLDQAAEDIRINGVPMGLYNDLLGALGRFLDRVMDGKFCTHPSCSRNIIPLSSAPAA